MKSFSILLVILSISKVYTLDCQTFKPVECHGKLLNTSDCLDTGCDVDTCCTDGPVLRCLDAYPDGCEEGLVLWDNPCIVEIEASDGVISCFTGEQCCQPSLDDIYPADPIYKTCDEMPSSPCPVEWEHASNALYEYIQECPPSGCTLETCCHENLCWRDGFCPDGWEVRPEMSCYHRTDLEYTQQEEEICSVETCCYDPVIGDPANRDPSYDFPETCLEYQEYLEDLGRPLVCNEGGFPSSLPCSPYENSENEFFYHNCTPNICCRTCANVMASGYWGGVTECPIGTYMLEKSCGYDFDECTPEKCCVDFDFDLDSYSYSYSCDFDYIF